MSPEPSAAAGPALRYSFTPMDMSPAQSAASSARLGRAVSIDRLSSPGFSTAGIPSASSPFDSPDMASIRSGAGVFSSMPAMPHPGHLEEHAAPTTYRVADVYSSATPSATPSALSTATP